MAAIKSYTDLEQSRKLAEILPLESADMYYYTVNGDLYKTPNVIESEDDLYVDEKSIPCWSLAALFSVLPYNYIDDNDTVCHPNLIKTKDGRYMVIYDVSQYTSLCNNPVDACYELILKLHELKML